MIEKIVLSSLVHKDSWLSFVVELLNQGQSLNLNIRSSFGSYSSSAGGWDGLN